MKEMKDMRIVSWKFLTPFMPFMSFMLLLLASPLAAQRPANAPETAPAGKAPDTVFLEELTWAEVRDAIKAGTTNVIIGTAGTEQKGPHMVDGEHKFVMEYAADKIARAIGRTLVAPVITYVPEGSWETVGGHMGKPGTITLPEDRFVELLVNAGRSLKAGGFTTIIFLGESGGNRSGMRTAATRLNELFKGEARAMWLDDYYTKSHADQNAYITKTMGIPANEIGGHANLLDTSELLFVNPKHIRKDKIAPGGGYQNSGVSGDPTRSSAELGKVFLQIKIDNTVAQYAAVQAGTQPLVPAPPQRGGGGEGRGGGRGGGRGRGGDPAGRGGDPAQAQAGQPAAPPAPRPPTMDTAPAGISRTNPPDTVFIDELTWEETRDRMKAGWRTAIVPTGGTEKNGYHMTLGKHNVIVTHAANLMARRLGNTLVAPTIQYVPEGNPDRAGPGVISHPSPAYDSLLDAAARSLKAHGFREILLIGDSGGNQAGLRNVANALNKEWTGQDVRVFALTDYYEQGRVDYRAWMLKEHGFDDQVIGSHAGISDTSQLLHVNASHVRKDQIMPWGGPRDSGVSGDPTKATAEIGRRGIEFKVNAALAQLRALKSPAGDGRHQELQHEGREGDEGHEAFSGAIPGPLMSLTSFMPFTLRHSAPPSGRIGFYAIIEKVVFEPNETAPERIQVWGAFMYVDGGASQNIATSSAKRGYLYFRLRSGIQGFTTDREAANARQEWNDLKAVAGTGQAVGFGSWGYIGTFAVLEPGGLAGPPSYLYERRPGGGDRADLRVRPANETPGAPATYQTETGVVKLSEAGSHAAVVRQLREALKR